VTEGVRQPQNFILFSPSRGYKLTYCLNDNVQDIVDRNNGHDIVDWQV